MPSGYSRGSRPTFFFVPIKDGLAPILSIFLIAAMAGHPVLPVSYGSCGTSRPYCAAPLPKRSLTEWA